MGGFCLIKLSLVVKIDQAEMCSLENRGDVYVLTITGDGEHRLNPTLLDAILAALHRVRSEVIAGSKCSALVTTAQGKFFSNGFDLGWARGDPHRILLMSSKLRSVVSDLINLPLPTIAAVTGHAAAGGYVLAISHDYVLMRRDRGFLYMSELDIELMIPDYFLALLRSKVGGFMARRHVVLRAAKMKAEEAVAMGVIDSAHDSAEATVAAAVKLGEDLVRRKWNGQIYGRTRAKMLGDVLDCLRYDETVEGGDKRTSSKL